jgi:phospholipid N-methyltransferase
MPRFYAMIPAAMASAFSTFFQRYLKNPSMIGAFAPTSLRTSRLMASFLPNDGPILEIGAGTGAITRAIMERIHEPSTLTSVEIDAELAHIFRAAFPKIILREEDAEEIMMNAKGIYAAIVSGLPFTSLPRKKSHALMRGVTQSLKDDGVFICFQYSKLKLNFFKTYFDEVSIHFSPINLPPAFVFVCRKKSALMEEITRQ